MNKLLEVAFSQYGITEFPGDDNNPEVLKYFKSIGSNYDDKYAWCSAYLNWCAKTARLEYPGKPNARSWLNVGKAVEYPILGDIAIFWRESVDSWKGHCAIYINEINDDIFVLGGNQNNKVCIEQYPKHRVLGYRRLHER